MLNRFARAATGMIAGGTVGAAQGLLWGAAAAALCGGGVGHGELAMLVRSVALMGAADAAAGALVTTGRLATGNGLADGLLFGMVVRFLLAPLAVLLAGGCNGGHLSSGGFTFLLLLAALAPLLGALWLGPSRDPSS
jgi:hypothetical protein